MYNTWTKNYDCISVGASSDLLPHLQHFLFLGCPSHSIGVGIACMNKTVTNMKINVKTNPNKMNMKTAN